jgi:hypothetical protein
MGPLIFLRTVGQRFVYPTLTHRFFLWQGKTKKEEEEEREMLLALLNIHDFRVPQNHTMNECGREET